MSTTVAVRGGFGVQSKLIVASTSNGAVNSVAKNVGVGAQIQAGNSPVRLTLLRYRIDLAPDVNAGATSVPTRWRVVVFQSGNFPDDISILQTQAFPAGSHPEIPLAAGAASPLQILADIWLDATQGDPGFNQISEKEWIDSGPTADPGQALCILVTPINDANMDQSILLGSNASVYLEVYGKDDQTAGQGEFSGASSLPRFDVGND